ncbi:MAG: class poly(R)-hydroxyalkanoic acid synthase [Pseudomonadota bacterium]|jgi:polyhydroxyalkanoate synthase
MSTPQYKTPQELLLSMSKESEAFLNSFAFEQSQEMMTEFSKAWQTIVAQSVDQPQKWTEFFQNYQQQQMNLWMNFLNPQTPVQTSSETKPAKVTDRRFAGKAWEENPVFNYLKQSYLLASDVLTKAAEAANLDEENQKRLSFYTRYFIDAMSPSNFAATNPEVMQLAIETKGQSLLDGLRNMLGDMEKGRISMTDESVFRVGENIAVTKGAVVFQNELMQLIQYKPTTEKVNSQPVVIVPPCINKFYIMDLQPANSLVKFIVDQGYTVFLISWVNPDESLANTQWDDYIEKGTITAFEKVRNITGAEKINTVSWCVGGTILGTALAVLSARNQADTIASATYLTTMLDFSDPGDLGVFLSESSVAQREAHLKVTKMLSGRDLATAFNMLRANDLIWSYVVNNYLKGQSPQPFDILYWNSDSTNMPADMYIYYLRNMYLENNLAKPNKLTICGQPIDLSNIKTPTYFLSTIEDHIAPWKSTFVGTELVGGEVEFVLGASGHIAGVINPASKNRRNYWVGGELNKGADHWLQTAESKAGSWWNHWAEWVGKQGGELIDAPQTLGNDDYKEIEPAPGSYVKKRIDRI